METLAIDLGKRSFHIHGITDEGEVCSRKVSRSKLLDMISFFSPQIVAMEACASAHYWGRQFEAIGHVVRLKQAYNLIMPKRRNITEKTISIFARRFTDSEMQRIRTKND